MNMINKPNLSLIICSRNRAAQLKQCLLSIDLDSMIKQNCELLLVNNASSDATSELMSEFAYHSDSIRYIYESRPGLSFARNAGIENSYGKIIAFTDDDCYLAQDYFYSAISAFESGLFSYCGGRVSIFDPADSGYGQTYHQKFELIPPRSFIPAGKILGANMLFRKDVIDKIGHFDVRLGAGTPFRCEDVEYCARASFAGFSGALVPNVLVMHHHGRKGGGPELKHLMNQDDLARGAYYVKNLIKGHSTYLTQWFKLSMKASPQTVKRELCGGMKYLLFSLTARFKRMSGKL